MENLSSRWRFRTDMSSVRSASGTAYLIFQKLQMKECTRVRSNTTPEVEWTEADSKIREIEWRNPFGFFFSATGDSKRAKNTVPILLAFQSAEDHLLTELDYHSRILQNQYHW